ncbi:MAG: type II toxin-antitoxin system HicB family antitoxin [Nitrosopumilus sp.]|nr:type II toxin-antitoxin system HicB family antitoxin [Nitrosopumilus sp.]
MTQQLQSTYVVYLEKENDGFVIDCPELSVTTQGDTEQEATTNIMEAIELFLETEGKSNNFNIDLRTK